MESKTLTGGSTFPSDQSEGYDLLLTGACVRGREREAGKERTGWRVSSGAEGTHRESALRRLGCPSPPPLHLSPQRPYPSQGCPHRDTTELMEL